MLVTPGATAYLLTDRFGRMVQIAVAMGVGSSAIGAYASYYFNGSTGGCIVVLQTLLFLAALIFGPKYGILHQRRQTNVATP
jgi:manganese/iron transport system permease protein